MTSSDTLPLSEDQQELQETLRGFLAGQLPPATLRAALETRAGYGPELHARLASEFGLTGLTIPREFGGRGMSQVEACVVHSELGGALYPGQSWPPRWPASYCSRPVTAWPGSGGFRCWPTDR